MFTALGGSLAGEVVKIAQERETTHATEFIKLRRGDPQLLRLETLEDL